MLIPVKPKSCEHRGDRVSMLFPRSIEKLKARPGSSGAWSFLIVLRFAAHFWGTQIALDSKNEDVSVDLDPISINYNMCFVVCPAPFVVFFAWLRSRRVLHQTVVQKFDINQFGRCLVAAVHASSIQLCHSWLGEWQQVTPFRETLVG